MATLVAALVLLAAALVPVGGAGAQEATAPTILCTWAVPDTNGDTTDGVQYGPDAAPGTLADAGGTPCTYDLAAGMVAMAPGAVDLVDAAPTIDPSGSTAMVEIRTAVFHPQGPVTSATDAAVTFAVVSPGSVRTDLTETTADCGGDIEPSGAWTWATTQEGGTGAMTPTAVVNADGNGMWEQCRQGQLDVFAAEWTFDASAPCGVWTLETRVAAYGSVATSIQSFNVVCVAAVMLDSDQVDFGGIVAGQTTTLFGDNDPGTPESPTVLNLGNVDIEVGVELSAMTNGTSSTSTATFDPLSTFVGVSSGTGVTSIESFGAALTTASGLTATHGSIGAGEVRWLDGLTATPALEAADAVLCSLEKASLDLMLHAPLGLVDGSYSGTVTLHSRAGAECGSAGEATP